MLLDVLADLPFEPFEVDHLIDPRRRYQLGLDPRFPLAVKPLSFSTFASTLRFNWHERLEIFVAAAGHGTFRMGDRVVYFAPSDVVVVDNLKLHGLIDCRGPRRHGVVITFMPELVCNSASYPCDSTYLLPFYSRPPELEPVLRANDRFAAPVHAALEKLFECYFAEPRTGAGREAGCKAYLLDALYGLARHFNLADEPGAAYDGRRRQSLQFGRFYEHLRENYSEPITVSQAAAIVGLSEFRFMKFFKRATGLTFVAYLTHLRLANAHRLLTETDLSIAEIAVATGFADQSYFDRRFRRHYNQSPREIRVAAGSSK